MFMDEGVGMSPDKTQAWTKSGFMDALKILLEEKNLLYESLANKLEDYPELKTVLYELLFTGRPIPYTALNQAIEGRDVRLSQECGGEGSHLQPDF